MIRDFIASAFRNAKNISGWRTNKRIVVIESDDWGSIRMPSKSVFDKFHQHGMNVADMQYNRYDALESNEDLEHLFQVLNKHHDKNNNPACFTANMIMANPAFEKIARSHFTEYHYEPMQETLRRYPEHNHVFTLYHQGLSSRVFKPQFHGREHVQINRWLAALRKADERMLIAFDNQTTYSGKDDYNFMESFDWDKPDEVIGQKGIIRDGLRIFLEAFGYISSSFIAPCYTWDEQLEPVLVESGVRFMQGGMNQYIPLGGFNHYRMKKHVMGQQLNSLTYITRNCFFEPSLVAKSDWVDYTLASIQDAFRWHKPAIICAHRINFIGFIDETNRMRNLKLLNELLKRICKKWPDVEFMSSDQLGELMCQSSNRVD